MAGTVEKKLEELGIVLPTPVAPVANYVPFVRSGNLLFVSGQLCLENGASDLMVAVFGDKGRHARTTVGVASLPADAAMEVEGIFEVA